MASSKLTAAQIAAMRDLVGAVRDGKAALAGSLPGSDGMMPSVGRPVAQAIKKILEALERCEGC